MWKSVFEMIKRQLLLAEETKRNRDDIEKLPQRVKVLSEANERLAYEVHRVKENYQHEREKMMLHLENELLKFERRLPPAKPEKDEE